MGNIDLLEDACDRARLARSTRAMFGGHGLFAPNGGMFAGIVDDDRIILKLTEDAPRGELMSAGGEAWTYKSPRGSMEMRDMMLEAEPELFYITDHYRKFPFVLVRLSALTNKVLKDMLAGRAAQLAAMPPIKRRPKKTTKKTAKKIKR